MKLPKMPKNPDDVVEALKKKGVNADKPCSECGHDVWAMSQRLAVLIDTDPESGAFAHDRGTAVLVVTCDNCGSMRLFAARAILG